MKQYQAVQSKRQNAFPNGAKQHLIISPQGGLGNRLRAINSALIIAERTGRKLFHSWLPTRVHSDHTPEHVQLLQKCLFEDFFIPNDMISAAKLEHVDEVFSEWGPGDGWFKQQSTGQRLFNVFARTRTRNSATSILNSHANTILLETTLRTWPEDTDGISLEIPSGQKRCDIYTAYQKLVPLQEYIDIIKELPEADIGLSIRRGNLLNYCQEARQDIKNIAEWSKIITATSKSLAVFSDDPKAQEHIYASTNITPVSAKLDTILSQILPQQAAFLSFLYLAFKCKFIFGTPGSSFAQEAALYGNKPYQTILSPKPFDTKP